MLPISMPTSFRKRYKVAAYFHAILIQKSSLQIKINFFQE
jgi:hypothetical protein